MNTVTQLPSPTNFFHKFFWEVRDSQGKLFAKVYRNKHGRTNMSRCGSDGSEMHGNAFMAGGTNTRAILKYARQVIPTTTDRFFIRMLRGGYLSMTTVA